MSGRSAGLDKLDSWQVTGLDDGDRTSTRLRTTGADSLGLDAGTLGDITRSATRHVWEGKVVDAVVAATRDDAHKTDDDALRESVCSPTNTLLN